MSRVEQGRAVEASVAPGPMSAQVAVIARRLGLSGIPTLLEPRRSVADAPVKLLFRNAEGQPHAVLSLSSPLAPGLVARDADQAAHARRMLGDPLGRVILEPISSGDVEGVTYVLLPWRRPMSDVRPVWIVQRTLLGPHLLSWLRDATRKTAWLAPREGFEQALEHVAGHARLSFELRRLATRATEALCAGAWLPRHVLAHNDLWKGNVLLDPVLPGPISATAGRFVIIDWAGAEPSGYPLYDLIRLGESLRLRRRALANEVRLHCQILGGTLEDAKWYLVAALGNQGLHLDHMPEERFVRFAHSCWSTLLSVM